MTKCLQFLTNQVDSLQLLKIYKVTSFNEITVENFILCPIKDLTGIYANITSKALANYLRLLSKN